MTLSVLQSLLPSFLFYRTLTLSLQRQRKDIFATVRLVSSCHALASIGCGLGYHYGLLSDSAFVSAIRLVMSGFFAYDIVHVMDHVSYYGKTASQVFILHHLLGLYGLGYVPAYLPYVPNILLTEATTPFINLSWYANKKYGRVKPLWYFANALVVVSGFIGLRVINLGSTMQYALQTGDTRLGGFLSGLLLMNISWTVKLIKMYWQDFGRSQA